LARIEAASTGDIKRTLELFPVSALKSGWDYLKGNKDELCQLIAAEADYDKISKFVMANFGRCKQHAYIFQPRTADHPAPESALPEVDPLGALKEGGLFYLGVATFTVLLRDPDFRQEDVRLLWPMRIQYRNDAMIVSFIVLERDVRALFEGEVLNVRRHIEERAVVEGISALGYQSLDLNKGVKELWAADYMDAFRSKFKKARSTTTENMDRERGIKATDPQLYESMQRLPLYETMFRVAPSNGSAVDIFQVNPSDGAIRMTRYTEQEEDSDEVIRRILEANL
jgi:hypothetical protein